MRRCGCCMHATIYMGCLHLLEIDLLVAVGVEILQTQDAIAVDVLDAHLFQRVNRWLHTQHGEGCTQLLRVKKS